VPKLVARLEDQSREVHSAAVAALANMGPLDVKGTVNVLSPTYNDISLIPECRFLAHFLGGGENGPETLIRWLGKPSRSLDNVTHDEGVEILTIFAETWEVSLEFPNLHDDLERRIAQVVERVHWNSEDLPLLQHHASNLQALHSTHAAAVQNVALSITSKGWISTISQVWLGHALFWLALVFAYPQFPQVQAIFFWNPWVRRILGLGYVGVALAWVPYLRRKLFAPFQESLLSDASLDTFGAQEYFEKSDVNIAALGRILPLREAIPEIKGEIVLEGESGLGKSMFLRSLVKRSRRLTVYLPSEKCAKGVLEAIQAKLHGPAQDPDFLRTLIYGGAIDICIDGLNEVTADTRAKVTEFMESYFKGNILLATQPLEWIPPSTATMYTLQPLSQDKIERFLLTRGKSLPEDATVSGAEYELACVRYLAQAFTEQQPLEELAVAKRILSNPMDLTVVAHMLAHGQEPDLFRLQEQQYKIMAADYARVQVSQFPLSRFSEQIYQRRLKDELALPEVEFLEELQCMERHKMVVIRHSVNAQGTPIKEWQFRHDKIGDFFIVQTFLGENNPKPEQHLGDPRFRGVYFLLAILLPLDAAIALRDLLVEYAADNRDHTVSDAFVQLLRPRKAA
jgi:hypothetical protein